MAAASSLGGGDALTLGLSQQPTRELSWNLAVTRTTAAEVSPLTSSGGQLQLQRPFDLQPERRSGGNSAYLIKNRINASVTWSKALFGDRKTTVGLFYEGSQRPHLQLDVQQRPERRWRLGNDLMYIPSGPGSARWCSAGGATDEARFWDIVYRSPELTRSMGKVTKRNGSASPWVNNFDLRLSQEVPGLRTGHRAC